MIFCELVNTNGEIIYSDIDVNSDLKKFQERRNENFIMDGKKHIYREYPHGYIRLIGDCNTNEFASNKICTRTANTYANLITILENIKKNQKTQYNIFSHNLITTHSRLQDEIESIIPEKNLARALTYRDQVQAIKGSLQLDIDSSAESIFEIAKRIIDLQAQITGFKILSGEIKPDITPHNIKKVLFNILYPYYEEFKGNNIDIKIYIDDGTAATNLVPLDYKVFNIAMHHFFNNAVKYACPNTHIDIRFDIQKMQLSFDMISIRIEKEEINTIFDLKVSGKNAQNLSGDGIGMFMLAEALRLFKTKMKIFPDYSITRTHNYINYTKNTFLIDFPR